jgi:CPA2 family monovalent cation:H+ antiporter-2
MGAATLLGMGLAWFLGWPPVSGFVFGLALSVASTVVLLRALQQHRLVQTDRGKIAVGWLIVEDLAMVLALVLLPALADAIKTGGGAGDPLLWAAPLGFTLLKVGAFVAFMLVVGRRIIPWLLHWVAHTGSRELFRLAVFAIALGVAFGAASLFGVSFALGAFFAGMILAESELSQRAAEETLPLRDAFAVLFFVSVGMLFNPFVLLADPWPVLATLSVIVVGKSLAAFAIMRAFGRSNATALTVAASLAQIGEFSFILAGLSVELELLPREGRDLILAGAILSIMLNPLIFGLAVRTRRKPPPAAAPAEAQEPADELTPTKLGGHTILVGYGRVGEALAQGLTQVAKPFVLVEAERDLATRAENLGYEVIVGNAADPEVLKAAGVDRAARMFVAVADGYEGGGIVEAGRKANSGLPIVARAHSEVESAHLIAHGADRVVMGESEIARGMLDEAAPSPSASAEPVGDAPIPTPDPPRQLILDDAERAVLAALRGYEIWPGEAFSVEPVREAAAARGFAAAELDRALDDLKAKDCLRDLGDGRVTFTKQGFLAALQPA